MKKLITLLLFALSLNSFSQNKGIYVYSKAFSSVSAGDFITTILDNQYCSIIVSTDNSKKLAAKLGSLSDTLTNREIEVQVLISNNQILGDTILFDKYLTFNSSIVGISGVHLDIEPQTFDDFKENKDKYMTAYISILKRAKKFLDSKNLKLYVAIPMYWSSEYLKQIYDLSDRVYIMAYEHPDINFIVRNVSEELEIDKSKTHIALRPQDFPNLDEFNNFVITLSAILSVDNFAVHKY